MALNKRPILFTIEKGILGDVWLMVEKDYNYVWDDLQRERVWIRESWKAIRTKELYYLQTNLQRDLWLKRLTEMTR